MTRALNHMSNATSQRVWKAMKGWSPSWEFLATLDRQNHIAMRLVDRRGVPSGHGPIPPLHQVVGASASRKAAHLARAGALIWMNSAVGTRASMARCAGYELFEWLHSQPAIVQDEVLKRHPRQTVSRQEFGCERFREQQRGTLTTLPELKSARTRRCLRAGV